MYFFLFYFMLFFFFFSSRRRHTRCSRDWSSDVCSSDLNASVEFPRNDRYRNIGIGYAWGNVAGEDLRLLGVNAAYRPLKGFQIMLRHQQLEHIEDETQTILSMNYETNRFESFSSRLIRRDEDTNMYFAWRRAGNRGIEYYVILGDPNARSFRETIILKAVVPLEIVFGRA